MINLEIREAFGIALLLVQAGLAAPLIWRLVRSSDRRGYSLVGEAIWVAIGLGWLFYGIATSSVTIMISGMLAALTSAAISVLVVSCERSHLRSALLLSGATALFIAIGSVAAGIAGFSFTLAVAGALQFIPQLFDSVRKLRTNTGAAGVSPVAMVARALYTLGWSCYGAGSYLWGPGAGQVDWPLLIWGIVGFVAFGLLALAGVRSRSAARLR